LVVPACSYEVTARSAAPPEKVFALLADALTWPDWAKPTIGEASWVSEGTPPPGGVGAVRKVGRWPMFGYEQVVVSDAPTHHAYTMVKGNPVKNYRADVHLTPDGDGTKITWGASFDAKIPGTGAAITAFYKRLIGSFAQKLARYAEAI
jgi:Polyketide cyclase / dehydrase and lipid transport